MKTLMATNHQAQAHPLPLHDERKVPGLLDYKPVKVPFMLVLHGNYWVQEKFSKLIWSTRAKHSVQPSISHTLVIGI